MAKRLDPLVRRCRELWDNYYSAPSRAKLRMVLKHLNRMQKSSDEAVLEEWRQCKDAADAEVVRLGMKRVANPHKRHDPRLGPQEIQRFGALYDPYEPWVWVDLRQQEHAIEKFFRDRDEAPLAIQCNMAYPDLEVDEIPEPGGQGYDRPTCTITFEDGYQIGIHQYPDGTWGGHLWDDEGGVVQWIDPRRGATKRKTDFDTWEELAEHFLKQLYRKTAPPVRLEQRGGRSVSRRQTSIQARAEESMRKEGERREMSRRIIEAAKRGGHLEDNPRKKLYIYPNKSAIRDAKRGLEARRKAVKSKKGGLDARQAKAAGVASGVMRARDIIEGNRINAYQVKAFFDRHQGNFMDAVAKGLKPEESRAIQAWLVWGGSPLYRQVKRAVKAHREGRKVPYTERPKGRRKKNPSEYWKKTVLDQLHAMDVEVDAVQQFGTLEEPAVSIELDGGRKIDLWMGPDGSWRWASGGIAGESSESITAAVEDALG